MKHVFYASPNDLGILATYTLISTILSLCGVFAGLTSAADNRLSQAVTWLTLAVAVALIALIVVLMAASTYSGYP